MNTSENTQQVFYTECVVAGGESKHNNENNNNDDNDDGNETAGQKVDKMRDNYVSKVGNYGEAIDNSVGWGKATNCGVVVSKMESVIVDDGHFQNLEYFKNLWRLKKNKNEKKYNNPEKNNLIGKWNEGATSSAICMGNLHHAFTNFEGKLYKNTFDVLRYIRTNKFPKNYVEANQDEIADFLYYQRMLNPNYNLEYKKGTMIRWGNLCKHNTQSDINILKTFLQALYTKKKFSGEIKFYNFVKDLPESGDDPTPSFVIDPFDITYGEDITDINVYVYETDKDPDFHSLVKKTSPSYTLKYEYIIQWQILSPQAIEQDCKKFGVSKEEQRVGFDVYRSGRKITHKSMKWNLSTGMDRARGLRIRIYIGPEADMTFKSGSRKCLRKESWDHFPESLTKILTTTFKDLNKLVGKNAKKKRDAFITKMRNLEAIIPNMSLNEIKIALEELNQIFRDNYGKGKPMAKKGTNAYKSFQQYHSALLNAKEDFTGEWAAQYAAEAAAAEAAPAEAEAAPAEAEAAPAEAEAAPAEAEAGSVVATVAEAAPAEAGSVVATVAEAAPAEAGSVVATVAEAVAAAAGVAAPAAPTGEYEDLTYFAKKQQFLERLGIHCRNEKIIFPEIAEWIDGFVARTQEDGEQEREMMVEFYTESFSSASC
jgi:hypothetical protein